MLTSCPIAGEYTGFLPDAPAFCARLRSDCGSPDKMHYTVTSCDNPNEVFEGILSFTQPSHSKILCKHCIFSDREYQCLGQWEETDRAIDLASGGGGSSSSSNKPSTSKSAASGPSTSTGGSGAGFKSKEFIEDSDSSSSGNDVKREKVSGDEDMKSGSDSD